MAICNHNPSHSRNSKGISLIEVLIALVILATCILALTLLQVSVTRSAADAKTRSFGMAFAQQELERLRAETTTIATYQALADEGVPTAIPITGSAAATGTQYNMARTVTRYVRSTVAGDCGGSPPCFVASTVDAGGNTDLTVPEYKTVAVTVTWTGADATAFSVTASDIFGKLSLSGSRALVGTDTSDSDVGPSVIKDAGTAGMDATGVIPIATGGAGGEATAASNPKPLVDTSTGTAATSFSVLTYRDPSTGNILVQREVETQMLSCKCEFGTPTQTGAFFTTKMRPAYWDGTFYATPTSATAEGVANDIPNARAAVNEYYLGVDRRGRPEVIEREINQSEYCSDCCRDHHDPGTLASTKPKFDPYLPSGVNHLHYGYPLDADGNAQTTPELVTSSSPNDTDTGQKPIYHEACRLIRVDGLWRVATDINLEHMSLIATNQTTVGSAPAWAPSTAAAARYVTFVKDFLTARRVDASATPAVIADTVLSASAVTALEEAPTPSLNNPTTLTMATSTATRKYLHNRGIYLDYTSPAAATVFNQVLKACTQPAETRINCLLPYLPFVTINTTELAAWTNTAKIQISNNALDSSDVGEPQRGVTQPVTGAVEGDTAIGYPNLYKSNSGLVFALPISDHDGQDLTTYPGSRLQDSQAFRFSLTGIADADNDRVPDDDDNCPRDANFDQTNTDKFLVGGDNLGDVCDNDDDADGVLDVSDNCPINANPDQTNSDGRLAGDACSTNSDRDTWWDDFDNCDLVDNEDQADRDSNGIGDACDTGVVDRDGDTVPDSSDNCPTVANLDQANIDRDSKGDLCDDDALSYNVRINVSGQAFSANPTMVWNPLPAGTGGTPDCQGPGTPASPLNYTCAGKFPQQTLKVSKYNRILVSSSSDTNNPCDFTTGSGSSRVTYGANRIPNVRCVLYTPGASLTVTPTRTPGTFSGVETSGAPFTGTGARSTIVTTEPGAFPVNNRSITYTMTNMSPSDLYSVTFTSRFVNLTEGTQGTNYTCDTNTASPTAGEPIYNFGSCN